MSSLDFTLEHIDDVIDRSASVAPAIDPARTALLVLDMQKLIVSPQGAAYVESVGGAPAGDDVVEPVNRVVEACRTAGVPVFWSKWGLRPDGLDAGRAVEKWPPLSPGTPESPASWGAGDDELDDRMHPRDDEPVFHKHRFSSFYNTPLDEWLRGQGRDTLIIAGVTSANCAHATAIDGWNHDYRVVVLADTTCSIPSGEHQPDGFGQHWEALRNIQMNYGDVQLSTEFVDKLNAGASGTPVAATSGAAY